MATIRVCAAVIRNSGRFLLCTRPDGKSMAGYWEFPGGKVKVGESDGECLRREIKEELGIDVLPLDRIYSLRHRYPDKEVELYFYRCALVDCSAAIKPLEGQKMQWAKAENLADIEFLPADIEFAKFLLGK